MSVIIHVAYAAVIFFSSSVLKLGIIPRLGGEIAQNYPILD
jgi:hypothetical protein